MHLSLFNNSLYEVLKMSFNVSLKEFYVYEYNLIKKFNFSYDHLNKITPAELYLYFNVISEELEREKKQSDQQQQRSEYGNTWPSE